MIPTSLEQLLASSMKQSRSSPHASSELLDFDFPLDPCKTTSSSHLSSVQSLPSIDPLDDNRTQELNTLFCNQTNFSNTASLLSLLLSQPFSDSTPMQLAQPGDNLPLGNKAESNTLLQEMISHSILASHNSVSTFNTLPPETVPSPSSPSHQIGTVKVLKKPSTSRRSKRNGRSTPGRRTSPNSTLRCDVCNQLYSRKDNLRAHQRVHNGEKPYKCSDCNASFRWLGALRTHQITHKSSSSPSEQSDSTREREPKIPNHAESNSHSPQAVSEYPSLSSLSDTPSTILPPSPFSRHESEQSNIPIVHTSDMQLDEEVERSKNATAHSAYGTHTLDDFHFDVPRVALAQNGTLPFLNASTNQNSSVGPTIESLDCSDIFQWDKLDDFILNDNFPPTGTSLPELSFDWMPVQTA